MLEKNHKYDDIINLPHHVSKVHPQMPVADRAAQFAPFAALTGHEEAVKETARLTERAIELDEEYQEILDQRLQLLRECLLAKPLVTITYFLPDRKKSGGAYHTITDHISKFQESNRTLLTTSGTAIPLDAIRNLQGELFEG